MEYILYQYSRDWADEFSIFGMHIMPKDLCNKAYMLLMSMPEDEVISWNFGTNEGFEERIGDFTRHYKFTAISPQEKEWLDNMFPGISDEGVGQMPAFYDVFYQLYDVVSDRIENLDPTDFDYHMKESIELFWEEANTQN